MTASTGTATRTSADAPEASTAFFLTRTDPDGPLPGTALPPSGLGPSPPRALCCQSLSSKALRSVCPASRSRGGSADRPRTWSLRLHGFRVPLPSPDVTESKTSQFGRHSCWASAGAPGTSVCAHQEAPSLSVMSSTLRNCLFEESCFKNSLVSESARLIPKLSAASTPEPLRGATCSRGRAAPAPYLLDVIVTEARQIFVICF